MSTADVKPEGYVVVTTINPKGNMVASSKTDPLQNFIKGEPLALGVTQILCGTFQFFIGIAIDMHSVNRRVFKFFLFVSGAPFWSGILYIICGSLAVATTKNPRIGLVRASLVMNIITAIASAVAIIIYNLHIFLLEDKHYYYCDDSEDPKTCRLESQAVTVSYGLFCVLLFLSILQFCISISIAVFGCKTLCRTAYNEVSVVIYQTTLPQLAQPTVSTVPPSLPDAHAVLPPFKEFERPSSVSLI